MIAVLTERAAGWLPRAPAVLVAGALALVGLVVAGPVADIIEAGDGIAQARDRLARTRAAAARPSPTPPFVAAEGDGLATALRTRLEAAALGRAVLVEGVHVTLDPDQPRLPLLGAALRGTAEGLHGVLTDLATGTPRVVTETAQITVASPADPTQEQPTVLLLSLGTRGMLVPPEAPSRPEAGR